MSSVSIATALMSSWIFFFSLGTLPVWGQTDERAKLIEDAKNGRKARLVYVDQRHRIQTAARRL